MTKDLWTTEIVSETVTYKPGECWFICSTAEKKPKLLCPPMDVKCVTRAGSDLSIKMTADQVKLFNSDEWKSYKNVMWPVKNVIISVLVWDDKGYNRYIDHYPNVNTFSVTYSTPPLAGVKHDIIIDGIQYIYKSRIQERDDDCTSTDLRSQLMKEAGL